MRIRSGTAVLWGDSTGTGAPVVLVHAGIADSRMWNELVPVLARTHRVVRYDLRGYGRSPLPPGTYSHVDDLAAVIAATGEDAVHVVGASLGGRIAIDLALRQPRLVRSLVLLGAVVGGFEPDVDPPQLWDDLVAAHRSGDLELLADVEARMWLADADGTRLPDGVLDLVRAMNRIAVRNERSGVAEESEPEIPAVDRLGELRPPVLVAVGDLDQPEIQLAADLLGNRVPAAERAVVRDAAHLPALEQPAAVAELVSRFLGRQVLSRQRP
jgi:3-oxoadipate enol-lactonase